MQNENPWETEAVSPRTKVISFIIRRVKEGASKEQLLDIEVPEFFDTNGLSPFPRWDVEKMIEWARKKSASSIDKGN